MFVEGRFSVFDKPADEFLTTCGHVEDDIVVLSDGSHVGMIRLEGKGIDLFDDDARYAERRKIHAALRNLAGPNVVVYSHNICHDGVEPFDLGTFRSRYARVLAQDYLGSLEKGLLSRTWFVTIQIKPSKMESLYNLIRGKEPSLNHGMVQQIRDRQDTLISMLKEYRPRLLAVRMERGVPYSEIGEAMRMVLYGRWAPVPMGGKLAGAIYTSRVVCGKRGFEILEPGGSRFGRMWGFRDYPRSLKPWVIDGLLSVPHRLVMTNSFYFATSSSTVERMSNKQTRMINAGDKARSLREGLDEFVDEIQSGDDMPGDHHWSLAVHADGWPELEKACGEVKTVLANTSNLSVTQEEMGCFNSYWAQIPGGPGVLRARHGEIKGYNLCSLSSFAGYPKGGGKVRWDRPTMRLLTVGRTAMDFSPHVRQVGQMLVIGPPGYGKSVFLGLFSAMLEQVLEPVGGVCVILDKDGSNEIGIRARGGYYAQIRAGIDSGMAPLKALPDTPESRLWLQEFVIGLIMADGKGPPSSEQGQRLAVAIAFLLRLPPEMRSLAGLRCFLDHGDGSTGGRLEEWCKGGHLAWAFDGDEDLIRFDAGIVGIDNTEILTDDKAKIRAPAASYQLHRIGEVVGRGRRGAVFIDEGASYLPDPRFAEGFENFTRTLRKGNGLLAIVVHGPDDLTRHPQGKILIQNSPMKLLFPNPAADEAAYRDDLHCSEGEIEAVIERMFEKGPGTFLVKIDTGTGEESFIAQASLSDHPDHVAVLSANPNTRALWHAIADELGTTDADRIWPAFLTRYREADA